MGAWRGGWLRPVTTGLVALLGGGIALVGVLYLAAPDTIVDSFGLSETPRGDARAFLAVKGVRDLATGLIVLTLLALGQRRALGWLALIAALIPLGDAIIVLSYGGSPATAYGVHGLTAVATVLAGVLLLREPTPRGPGGVRPE